MENGQQLYPIKITLKDCYVKNPFVEGETTTIYVPKTVYDKTGKFYSHTAWKYINGDVVLVPLMDDESLKYFRERQCFQIVDNRSPMWYNNLSEEHRQELNDWYQAWLDVTETKIIPEKPEWL